MASKRKQKLQLQTNDEPHLGKHRKYNHGTITSDHLEDPLALEVPEEVRIKVEPDNEIDMSLFTHEVHIKDEEGDSIPQDIFSQESTEEGDSITHEVIIKEEESGQDTISHQVLDISSLEVDSINHEIILKEENIFSHESLVERDTISIEDVLIPQENVIVVERNEIDFQQGNGGEREFSSKHDDLITQENVIDIEEVEIKHEENIFFEEEDSDGVSGQDNFIPQENPDKEDTIQTEQEISEENDNEIDTKQEFEFISVGNFSPDPSSNNSAVNHKCKYCMDPENNVKLPCYRCSSSIELTNFTAHLNLVHKVPTEEFESYLEHFHSKSNFGYKCALCNRFFPHFSGLLKHVTKEHRFCNLCGMGLRCIDATNHIIKHQKQFKSIYRCLKCHYEFIVESSLVRHIKTVHPSKFFQVVIPKKKFRCLYCHFSSLCFKVVSFHMRFHRIRYCKSCGSRYFPTLNNIIQDWHSQCQKCNPMDSASQPELEDKMIVKYVIQYPMPENVSSHSEITSKNIAFKKISPTVLCKINTKNVPIVSVSETENSPSKSMSSTIFCKLDTKNVSSTPKSLENATDTQSGPSTNTASTICHQLTTKNVPNAVSSENTSINDTQNKPSKRTASTKFRQFNTKNVSPENTSINDTQNNRSKRTAKTKFRKFNTKNVSPENTSITDTQNMPQKRTYSTIFHQFFPKNVPTPSPENASTSDIQNNPSTNPASTSLHQSTTSETQSGPSTSSTTFDEFNSRLFPSTVATPEQTLLTYAGKTPETMTPYDPGNCVICGSSHSNSVLKCYMKVLIQHQNKLEQSLFMSCSSEDSKADVLLEYKKLSAFMNFLFRIQKQDEFLNFVQLQQYKTVIDFLITFEIDHTQKLHCYFCNLNHIPIISFLDHCLTTHNLVYQVAARYLIKLFKYQKSVETYPCLLCPSLFNSDVKTIANHMKNYHCLCRICGEQNAKQSHLQQHDSEFDSIYHCGVCSAEFTFENSFLDHVSCVHPEQNDLMFLKQMRMRNGHECPYCHFSSESINILNFHLTFHRKVCCKSCKESFVNSAQHVFHNQLGLLMCRSCEAMEIQEKTIESESPTQDIESENQEEMICIESTNSMEIARAGIEIQDNPIESNNLMNILDNNQENIIESRISKEMQENESKIQEKMVEFKIPGKRQNSIESNIQEEFFELEIAGKTQKGNESKNEEEMVEFKIPGKRQNSIDSKNQEETRESQSPNNMQNMESKHQEKILESKSPKEMQDSESKNQKKIMESRGRKRKQDMKSKNHEKITESKDPEELQDNEYQKQEKIVKTRDRKKKTQNMESKNQEEILESKSPKEMQGNKSQKQEKIIQARGQKKAQDRKQKKTHDTKSKSAEEIQNAESRNEEQGMCTCRQKKFQKIYESNIENPKIVILKRVIDEEELQVEEVENDTNLLKTFKTSIYCLTCATISCGADCCMTDLEQEIDHLRNSDSKSSEKETNLLTLTSLRKFLRNRGKTRPLNHNLYQTFRSLVLSVINSKDDVDKTTQCYLCSLNNIPLLEYYDHLNVVHNVASPLIATQTFLNDKSNDNDEKYQCLFCKSPPFRTSLLLGDHVRTVHDFCRICGEKRESTDEHSTQHNEFLYVDHCLGCRKEFTSKETCENHCVAHHSGKHKTIVKIPRLSRSLYCPYCHFHTKDSRKIINFHIKQHRLLNCIKCGMRYVSSANDVIDANRKLCNSCDLKINIEIKASKSDVIKLVLPCLYCNESIQNKYELFSHLINKHHACLLCNEQFESFVAWSYHNKVSHLLSYRCKVCDTIVTSHSEVELHAKQFHSSKLKVEFIEFEDKDSIPVTLKPMQCPYCLILCGSDVGLIEHIMFGHNIKKCEHCNTLVFKREVCSKCK